MEFGDYGVWTSFRHIGGEENGAEAAAAAEAAGFTTFWLGGSPRLSQVRSLLEGSDQLLVGTSIVNIWSYDPNDLTHEFAELEADFPGRVCVGIGVGHPEATSDYRRPRSALEGFLDVIDGGACPIPKDRRIIAALAPKMLTTCVHRSLGTIPYFTSVEHTRWARRQIGPEALLIPELACVVDENVERARATAREYAQLYFGLRNYTNALVEHGFEEADIVDGGSDRLIDHVIPHGSAAEIAAAVEEHRDAGADQVCVQPIGGTGIPVADWHALAAALG